MYKNRFSNSHLQIIFTFSIITLLSGCGLVKGVRAIKNKKVKPQYYTFEDKSIIFTPLTHFGQKEFYDHLKDSIVHWKNNGYTIFYEGVKREPSSMNLDSISVDNLMRKWRKIVGGEQLTREGYAELSEVFKKGIVQPENEELGMDSTDINADITLLDLVSKFEEYYGEVKIDSCDYATHLDSTYTCSKKLKGNLMPIILDYRNTHLVEKVIDTELYHIVVLYGKVHIKGMKKLLTENKTAKTSNYSSLERK